MSDRPYARLYLDLVDDEKFATVYDDDHHFAAWARLLMIAEGAWPASAHLPSSCRRASLSELVRVGLIDTRPGGRYRIHGLDAERELRSDRARTASSARWSPSSNAGRNAPASGPRMLDETRRDEHSRDEQREAPDDLWRLYSGLTRAVSIKPAVMDWLTRLEERYGASATAAAMTAEHKADPNLGTLLSRTEKRAEAAARKDEADAEKRKRADRTQAAMTARRIEQYRYTGKWDPAWGPEPEGGA